MTPEELDTMARDLEAGKIPRRFMGYCETSALIALARLGLLAKEFVRKFDMTPDDEDANKESACAMEELIMAARRLEVKP